MLLPGARGAGGIGAGLGLQVAPQVFKDLAAPGVEAGDALVFLVPLGLVGGPAPRQFQFDARLECIELHLGRRGVGLAGVPLAVAGGGLGVHLVVGQRRAEVESAASGLLGTVEHAVFDLQGGDALARKGSAVAGLLGRRLHPLQRRHPPVAVADQADKKGTGTRDLRQTDLEYQALLGLFLRRRGGVHAPAQINGLEVVEARLEPLLQLREDEPVQVVTLRLKVAEGAGHEDGARLPDGEGFHGSSGLLRGAVSGPSHVPLSWKLRIDGAQPSPLLLPLPGARSTPNRKPLCTKGKGAVRWNATGGPAVVSRQGDTRDSSG